MRLLVLVILVIFVFFAVTDVGAKKIVLPSLDFPQGKSMRQEEVKQPDFKFDHHTYDFGKFSKKKKQQHIFTFTNTGNAPLVILHIATGCGCTTTSYTKEPILPGKKGEIKVQFDGSGLRPGVFRKTITVYTNSPKKYTRLAISGETIEK